VIETSRIAKSPQRECITLDRTPFNLAVPLDVISLRQMGWHRRRLGGIARVRSASGTEAKVPAPKTGLARLPSAVRANQSIVDNWGCR
jgi:hypothetical protein